MVIFSFVNENKKNKEIFMNLEYIGKRLNFKINLRLLNQYRILSPILHLTTLMSCYCSNISKNVLNFLEKLVEYVD